MANSSATCRRWWLTTTRWLRMRKISWNFKLISTRVSLSLSSWERWQGSFQINWSINGERTRDLKVTSELLTCKLTIWSSSWKKKRICWICRKSCWCRKNLRFSILKKLLARRRRTSIRIWLCKRRSKSTDVLKVTTSMSYSHSTSMKPGLSCQLSDWRRGGTFSEQRKSMPKPRMTGLSWKLVAGTLSYMSISSVKLPQSKLRLMSYLWEDNGI